MKRFLKDNLHLMLPVMFIFCVYLLIETNNSYKKIKNPTKDFIEEVKVKYISNLNKLDKEAIEVKSDTEHSCKTTELNTKEISLRYTETKIGTVIDVLLHRHKVKFKIDDFTNELGVDPKFEQYIKKSKEACLNLLKAEEEQKEKQRAKKQISLLKD